MSDDKGRESMIRSVAVTYFPMFIATLSLVTSIYNGYLNGRFVDLVQNNVARVEYMKACKEIIDGFFQVKHRVRMAAGVGGERSAEAVQAQSAVAHFSALGTYLANLRNERVRQDYTELALLLGRIAAEAPRLARDEIDKRLEPADQAFGPLNDDCVRSAKGQAM